MYSPKTSKELSLFFSLNRILDRFICKVESHNSLIKLASVVFNNPGVAEIADKGTDIGVINNLRFLRWKTKILDSPFSRFNFPNVMGANML